MLITQSFDVDQPVDNVWNFFENVPLIAACIPGADLT
ncbi:MAG: carbon monoxide dehydrogenase, partial [Actinobacteria bacterium]|nr:carbon monoxide dehydrogenase [Actinomycetota bacterium]